MARTPRPRDVTALAGLFAVSGTLHLLAPGLYEPIVPRGLPARRRVVLGSGMAELVCAAGLLTPATRRPAGLASAALLVGLFPANLTMALDAVRSPATGRGWKAAALARLPLQLPLVRTAVRAGRDR